MDRVLFVLDHKLHDYRAPLFCMLSKYFDVTVVHRGPKLAGEYGFSQCILNYRRFGPFEYVVGLNLKSYDVVIYMQNIRMLNIYLGPFLSNQFRVKYWGIGASSAKGLRKDAWAITWIRNTLTFFSDGLALYSSFPLDQYWYCNRSKLNVVGNSIRNPHAADFSGADKEHILFIGTLDARKGVRELIASVSRALETNENLKLVIAGDGVERGWIERDIIERGLQGKVEMLGRVVCPSLKRAIFSKAFCVVSPFQAGLGVVESFSYGVPFVTSKYAVTGGEALSIIDGVNGALFEDVAELDDILISFIDGRRSTKVLGRRAYELYASELSFDGYVERFVRFINTR